MCNKYLRKRGEYIMDNNMKRQLAESLAREKERISNFHLAHIVYDNGRTVDGRVCITFDSEDTNYQYIVFTDETKTRDGLYVVYAVRYDVINSVLYKTGYEFAEDMEYAEIEMIKDVINTHLVRGTIIRKPACSLKIGGVKSVSFE